jgi:hypothetical protein
VADVIALDGPLEEEAMLIIFCRFFSPLSSTTPSA